MLQVKNTSTNPYYLVLTAFPRQQWLRERVSLLRYRYTAGLVHKICSMYQHYHPQPEHMLQ